MMISPLASVSGVALSSIAIVSFLHKWAVADSFAVLYDHGSPTFLLKRTYSLLLLSFASFIAIFWLLIDIGLHLKIECNIVNSVYALGLLISISSSYLDKSLNKISTLWVAL
jgi:hypothetical protein